eukprot:g7408.t1
MNVWWFDLNSQASTHLMFWGFDSPCHGASALGCKNSCPEKLGVLARNCKKKYLFQANTRSWRGGLKLVPRLRTRVLTSFYTIEQFDAFLGLVNADGVFERIQISRAWEKLCKAGKEFDVTIDDKEPDEETQTHGTRRVLEWQDAVLLVLVRCRMGLEYKQLHPFFNISDHTCRKYFQVFLQALVEFLMSEFPMPTAEQIVSSIPSSMRTKYPNLQFLFDAHETRMEIPSNLRVANTTWSDYKHCHTAKCLGVTSGIGTFLPQRTFERPLDCAEPRPGRCSDPKLIKESQIDEYATKGYCSLADKGFLVHALFAAVEHELQTPWKKVRNVHGFEEEATLQAQRVGNVRIHVERAFKRAQEWQILIKLSRSAR